MVEIPTALASLSGGILECLDRLVLTVIPQGIEYPQAYINHLRGIGVNPYEHTAWASGHRDKLESYLKSLAAGAGMEILSANDIGRKDDKVKDILTQRGHKFGLICIIKGMERCRSYYYAKTKQVKGLPLYFKSNKCMHFYVYVFHEALGLVQIRIQTYAPFYCQIIVNGHRILERSLLQHGIEHKTRDNAFEFIADFPRAQELANSISSQMIESLTIPLVYQYFPFLKEIGLPLRYSIRQVEWSTDIIAKADCHYTTRMADIIARLALFEPDDIARFMVKIPCAEKKASLRKYETEFGSCIRFSAGDSSVKLYDKGTKIFRIETTCLNISTLRGYRTTTHKDGKQSKGVNYLSKHISSLELFINIASYTNQRFIQRLGSILSTTYNMSDLDRITERMSVNGISVRGFSFFDRKDRDALLAVANPANDVSGFKRNTLIKKLPGTTPYQASYIIKRMRIHGLIKKIPQTNRYHLTKDGRTVITTMHILTAEQILPRMCA